MAGDLSAGYNPHAVGAMQGGGAPPSGTTGFLVLGPIVISLADPNVGAGVSLNAMGVKGPPGVQFAQNGKLVQAWQQILEQIRAGAQQAGVMYAGDLPSGSPVSSGISSSGSGMEMSA